MVSRRLGHAGSWDAVHADTLTSTTGILLLCDSSGVPLAKDTNLAFAGSGEYGIRIHARGRDTTGEPVTDWTTYKTTPLDFLVQLWSDSRPAHQAPLPAAVQGPFPVDADEHQIYIAGSDAEGSSDLITRSGREGQCAAAHDDFVHISTGIACGSVNITAHLSQTDPGPGGAEWEQVSEFTVRSTEGELLVQSLFGGGEDLPPGRLRDQLRPHRSRRLPDARPRPRPGHQLRRRPGRGRTDRRALPRPGVAPRLKLRAAAPHRHGRPRKKGPGVGW